MSQPRSLYWWLIEFLVVFGLLMLAALARLSYSGQQLIEHKIWREMLVSLSARQALQIQQGQLPVSDPTGVIRFWYLSPDEVCSSVPPYLRNLAPGYYTSEAFCNPFSTTDCFHALVTKLPAGRLVAVIDIGDLETQQDHDVQIAAYWMLIIFLVIGAMIAWLHYNLVRPVKDLADRMESAPPKLSHRLPTDYRQKEIRIIAEAGNAYLTRVEQCMERERSLLDQASHEFRTPVAVISGALDRLKQLVLPETSAPALARMDHAVRDLSETMTELLYLAREPDPEMDKMDVTELHELLPQIVQDHEHLVGDKHVRFRVGEFEPTFISAPQTLVRIAVGNLVRNAVENTRSGDIRIRLSGAVLTIADSGNPADGNEALRHYQHYLRHPAPVRGQGLGLFLIQRISERTGWKLNLQPSESGTLAALDFSSSLIPL